MQRHALQPLPKRLVVALLGAILLGMIWQARWHVPLMDGGGVVMARGQSGPTFNKEVVRILQRSCQTCHHPGDIAPFSLMSYQEARPWAVAIREQVLRRQMPPWKPVEGCGDFQDVPALSEAEIQTIAAWVDSGAPEGQPSDLPAPLEFPDGWALGAPDLVLTPAEPYAPPPGRDLYRCFSVPVGDLRGDRWISALSVKPGTPAIVHHVIAYADLAGESAQLDAAEPGPGYTCFGGPRTRTTEMLGGWAPGSRGYFAPDGTGIRLANNSRVVIQVHYSPTEQPESDRTLIGLYFAKRPVRHALQVLPLVNTQFVIPAGSRQHEVNASFTIPFFLTGKMWAVTPHMHLLGRRIKVELQRPGNTQPNCLIDIPDWDFNWQGTYLYRQPVSLTGGATLKLTTIFDNSASNPRNPSSPPKEVRWGEETTDEMSLAFIGFTVDGLELALSTPVLQSVALDSQGALVVEGTGFLPGAEIEIDGRSVRDTSTSVVEAGRRLLSPLLWKVPAAPGAEVSVRVLNPDGVLSAARPFVRPGTAMPLATVSAANYSPLSLAPSSIVVAFGSGLASSTAAATSLPLPTSLDGTSVRVNGVVAPLFFVSPGQVNFLIPESVQTGSAIIEIGAANGAISRQAVSLAQAAPALFTSNAQGTGAPAALATRDGVVFREVGNPDGTPNPVGVGDYLVLFGTGLRHAPRGSVEVTLSGQPVPLLYVGPQGTYEGLDQLNLQIPPGLKGLVDLVLSVNEKAAPLVRIRVE
ncbi:MAG: hypothetical protein ACO394_08820 [Blastocatellia bacterium]